MRGDILQYRKALAVGKMKIDLSVCSRDDFLSERRGMYSLIAQLMEFGRKPRMTNRPESAPSLYEVI